MSQKLLKEIDIIEKELTPERFLRKTNNGGNELYIINHHNSPNIIREVGRLRELPFRRAGGGTGKDIDIDNNNMAINKIFCFIFII